MLDGDDDDDKDESVFILSLQKLQTAVGSHQHYQGSSSGFVIHHYAGKVRDILDLVDPCFEFGLDI